MTWAEAVRDVLMVAVMAFGFCVYITGEWPWQKK